MALESCEFSCNPMPSITLIASGCTKTHKSKSGICKSKVGIPVLVTKASQQRIAEIVTKASQQRIAEIVTKAIQQPIAEVVTKSKTGIPVLVQKLELVLKGIPTF